MSHLDDRMFAELIDGELDESARDTATRHLASCGECRARYEEARLFATESDRLIAAVEPPRPLRQHSARLRPARAGWRIPWRTVGWAASLVAATGLGYLIGVPRHGTEQSEVAAADEAPPSDAPAQQARPPKTLNDAPLPSGNASGAPAPTSQPSPSAARKEVAPAKPAPSEAAPQAAVRRYAMPEPAAGAVPPTAGSRASSISSEAASARLGSALRHIEGLVPVALRIARPEGFEQQDATEEIVRVVYPDSPARELWLDQRRDGTAEVRDGRTANLLAGDTVLTTLADGRRRLEWLGPDGVRLSLSGFLPADSLKALARRVR